MFQTFVQIDGMACGMCEAHVCETIRKIMKVKKVTASHKKREAVIISEEAVNRDMIAEAIGKTGYKVLAISEEPYEKKGFFRKK